MTPREAGTLAHHSLNRATELVVRVRDEGVDSIAELLDPLDRQALYGLTVALAALVPDDQPRDVLLAWMDDWTPGAETAA